MKSNLLKSIFISLILVMGVGNAWALDIYLDISAADWPKDGATLKLYPGTGSDITGTSVATNLYKFTVTSATGTMWFKRMSGSSTWNQASVSYNSSYNLYKLTEWNAAACSNANVSIATKTHYIYFDNSTTNWSNSYKYFVIGHDYPSNYSKVYSMSALGHTKLWYVSQSSDSWTDLTYYAICSPTSSWSGTSWGSSNISNANKYAAPYKGKYDMNNGSSYLFTPASSSNNCALTIDYKNGYSALNYSQTLKKYTSTDNGSSYSAASINSGIVTITPYKLTGNGTVSNSSNTGTIDEASETSVSKDAVYTGEVTVKASENTGYDFVGWFTAASGGSAVSTETSYTYNAPKSTKTIYARFKAQRYSITYKDQGNATFSGTHASGYPTTHTYGTATTLKTASKTGYTFEGWHTDAACTNKVTSLGATEYTANITLYAKWTLKATYSLNVVAGDGISQVAGSTDPITLGNTYDIKATPKTGYTFSTWTANPAGNATFGSATTANTTVTVKNGSVTVTASATENMSTLTTSNSYTEGNPGYAAPIASVNSIGIATTATVTATAAGNGYTFTGWTLTNCTRTDGGADNATNITVRSNGDGAAATVIANYEKLPPTTVYINPKTDWEETLKIICDGEEADMTPVGCAGEYYTAEVPGGTTELKFGGNNEQTLPLTVPADDKVLYDMTSTHITKLYLKANSNWKADGARFAAYFFGNGDKWVSMTAVAGQTDLYEVAIPTDKSYPSVIFCRMDGGNQTNDWSNKWNQTNNLTIPADGKNTAHLPSSIPSGNADVTWHKVWDNSCWTTYEPSNTYTISFDRQGATTGTESVEATVGDAAPDVEIERTGYTFGGYYTEANGEGTQIIDAEGKWINGTNYVDADGNWISTDCNITFYAQWTEITYTVNISASENGTVSPSGEQQIGLGGLEVTATPKDPSNFRFTKWEVSGGAQVADSYGATTTITATAEGTVIAHFEELQPKTIYLKTVEGTTDGYEWCIKYGEQEYQMDELGCTGEYYRGVVPEQTEFQLIAKDNGGNIIAEETRDGLVVPDNSNMLNLVSAAASGNKIFFKPNQQWVDEASNKNYYFAGRFWTGSAVWKEMTDDNGDGIYECEKPTNGNEVISCLVNNTDNIENWGDNWDYKQIQTNGDDAYKQIPNGSNLFTITDNNQNNAIGTWSEFADTPVNGEGEWTIFEGVTYRITFNHGGATSGTTTPGVAYVDAQHNSSMPVIELESLPKNTDWKFAGYYTAADGGTAITNAFGDWLDADGYISNGKWVKEECVTLHAHWVEKTPEITNVTLGKDVFDVGSTETTTATPTVVQYAYQGTYYICWKMLDNSGTVMDLFPFTPVDPRDNNSVSFSVDGLTSGTYTVRASIYASACDTGEELSRFDAKITIVSGYKVTVKYLCDGEVIQAPSIAAGHATTPVEITAPEIGGYKFVNWELGDGIFSESDLKSETIEYTAIYDGYLTAKYEKKKLIFLDLSNQFGETEWTEPHIYLYSGSYWDNTNGTGGNNANCIANGAMTRVGTSNIWYYDYESVKNFNGYVAFTPTDQSTSTRFTDTEAIYRYDFSSGTPVFVPAQGQIPHLAYKVNGTKAQYYNKGHWTKYMGGTGYTLKIYNKKENERTEVMSVPFTGSSLYLPFTAIADLEEGKTYGYKIVRDNDKWYKNDNDGTMTVNSHTNWPFVEDNSNGLACGIQTVATGDHTFTLTLNATTGNLEVSVDYPAKVGNYRILYTDDVRDGRYKPSQIISKNNKEPLVSFFIRPNDNPTLKVQSAAHITDGGVTWYTADNHIYFKPNDLWKSDNARFAAYFYKGNTTRVWKDLTKNGDIYTCEKPSGCTHVIFCRMNPDVKTNSFDKGDGKPLWNQTRDLTLPTDKKNFYTLEEGAWRGQIYLKPNSNWTADGARFAAYFFEKSGENTTKQEWHSMFKEDDGTYWCDIPEGCSQVIFCRMNPNVQDNNWNTGDGQPFWGMQTNDLQIPTNSNDLYTITNGQNKPTGAWSCKSWSTISGSITDLSVQLKNKLAELDLKNIKETEGSVFNIHLSNNEGILTIEKVAFYTGNFYIRVDAVDGKWYDYKTNPDNLMTYSAFSESDENSFGEKFSHYKTKWCTREKGELNVKFVIANDYSLCISDTLTQDEGNPFGNIDEHGNITNEEKYDANIRFMWNRHTNKVSRAYVAGASGDNTRFLVLKADQTIQNESGQAINNNEVVFKDTENWLYERTIKVQPGTLVKLIAYYPDGNKAQYFRGTDANGFEENVSAVKILGGNNEDWYTMRIIYDFKTNRLMAAWVPDQKIDGTLAIDADIMVIRQHQEDATYITFANNKSQLSNVKTVYGVMRFNRWTLNNRSTSDHNVLPVQSQKTIYERALYFISFPFDVHLSDVFGFGTYGTHWVISEYNGLRRAQNGYFIDNCMNEDCTNWDYIWDPSNFTMKANQGYLLSLDLDLMKHDNESFWKHDIQQVELFFPSYAHVQTIQQTNYTMPALSEDYYCKINFNKVGPEDPTYNPVNDHRVRDSYWRCIGVPSFADYNSALTTDGTDKITWNPKGSDLPFLYEWNVADNSLMVRAATNYKFRSTFAYLVQNGNSIYWSAVNAKPSNIVARSQEAKRNYDWKITIARNGEVEDQTFVRLTDHEKVTTEFDFNQDLSKEFNYGRSDIYTLIGYEKAAANSLPLSEQTTLIPLGLSIEYNGDYTIAMPDGTANIGVTLIDTESNTRTNLSAGMEYTLTLKKGDYNNRFFIEISPIQQTPTDIEYVENSHDDQARKVLIDNILYIVCDGQIFDARGARLK